MGNSPSARTHHDDSVDYGSLTPQGVYTGPRDWNHNIVGQLIVGRKLAPFYRPLEDYDASWDDDQILAARKELSSPEGGEQGIRPETASIASASTRSTHSKRPGSIKEQFRPEAMIYRGAVECPICFLYYPSNINHSRCCDQAICTECFVQIKRNEPTTTHIVSEPACCPYCVQENFGVVYNPPSWRAGIGSENWPSLWAELQRSANPSADSTPSYPTHKRRQKSFGAESPEVVTIDHIRPGWEAKLAAVQAAVARRANRRIIMREVGGRLIPVGVTSGRVHALSPEEAASIDNSEGGNGSRRRRRPNQGDWMGMGMEQSTADLEELMLMEAMRLSLLEHEEQQRKQAEEQKKKAGGAGADSAAQPDSAGPGPSTLVARGSNEDPNSLSVSSSLPSSGRPRGSSSASRTSQNSSRSHTPPVNLQSPMIPGSAMSLGNDWRQRNANSTPFAAAVVSAARTASALIPPSTEEPIPDHNQTEHVESVRSSAIPTVQVESGDESPPSQPQDQVHGQLLRSDADAPRPSSSGAAIGTEERIGSQAQGLNGDPSLPIEVPRFERRYVA